LGPWEKNPANPILSGNEAWKCPGHGSIVQDEQGRFWLMYHAYSAKDFVFTGREALLDEVKFGANDWPRINDGHGPGIAAPSPLGAIQQRSPGAGARVDFLDDFAGGQLRPGWQWPQDNEPDSKSVAGKEGGLILSPEVNVATNLLGAILARSTTRGDYEAAAILHRPKPGVFAGIAAIGDIANATGLAVRDEKLVLWRRDKGTQKILSEIAAPEGPKLHLRLRATDGHLFRFEASANGENWVEVGDPQRGDQFPPWDRSIRVGLTTGGAVGASANFQHFEMRSLDQ
jgi:xylan 1,4-beta-xylosidase